MKERQLLQKKNNSFHTTFAGESPIKLAFKSLQMLITPEPELDFLAAIKIAVSSKAKHWQLSKKKKAYDKKNGYIFIENLNNHHYYHSQRLPLMEKCLHCSTVSSFI